MIVADASLIGCFAIRGAHSELADAVLEQDAVWVSPLLWRSEFRDALARYVRHAGMTMESALLALRLAEEVINGREYNVSSEKVLELAAQSKCSAYDCEYAALAQDLNVPLVTTDRQIFRAFPETAVSLEQFAKQK